MNVFRSKFSPFVNVITAIGCFVLLQIIVGIILNWDAIEIWISGTVLFMCISIPVYFVSILITQLELTRNQLIIHELFGKRIIEYSSIINVQRIFKTTQVLRFGSHGFFGYVGITMDGSNMNVKDRKKMVLIETNSERFILSCENPEEFVVKLNSFIRTNPL